jgi:predicted AlkP superfamily pyrophosphatase or phosphodiesterase
VRLRRLAATCALLGAAALGAEAVGAPRLAVVIVVDQLRPDYLVRFRPHFSGRGFNLLLAQGAWLTQARYDHSATVTCPGHATVLTGSPPAVTGIIANDWWNAAQQREEYCARDDAAKLLGADAEGRSPRNLIGATVGDMLKLASNGRGRVVTVAGKDRSAIMLGGRLADAAYWLEGTRFATSTYYMSGLPDWVARFNASDRITRYIGATWDYALPAGTYTSLGPDAAPGERDEPGIGRTFPRVVGEGLTDEEALVEAFEHSPFHNDVVAEFAMQAVREGALGKGPATDLLAIGLAANDRIGHAFGPDSHEVLDVTIRTDRLLERLFTFLDAEVGLENVVIMVTADHGVAPLPETLHRLNASSGGQRIDSAAIRSAAAGALAEQFGVPAEAEHWIAFHDAPYVYLDVEQLAAKGVDIEAAELAVQAALEALPGVHAAYTHGELRRLRAGGMTSEILSSFHPERSGNVYYVMEPFIVEHDEDDEPGGTSHGSPWSYDQRVPILWYGADVAPGQRHGVASVRDIAPTLALLIGVEPPPGATGRVLTEVLR